MEKTDLFNVCSNGFSEKIEKIFRKVRSIEEVRKLAISSEDISFGSNIASSVHSFYS